MKYIYMGRLSDTLDIGLRMRRECQQRFFPLPTPKETVS